MTFFWITRWAFFILCTILTHIVLSALPLIDCIKHKRTGFTWVHAFLAILSLSYLYLRWQYVCTAFFPNIPHINTNLTGRMDFEELVSSIKIWNEDIFLLCAKLIAIYVQRITCRTICFGIAW